MKAFYQLTWRGQARRIRQFAIEQLNNYELEVKQVRFLGWYTNLLFRVDAIEGAAYVFRVCARNWRTDMDLISEAKWLAYIHQEGSITAPVPVLSKSGLYLNKAVMHGIESPVRYMLFTMLPGKTMGEALTEANVYKMGQLFTQMHEVSLGFKPDDEFTTRQMNCLFPREEKNALFSEAILPLYGAKNLDIYREIRKIVEDAYVRRYANKDGLRVIHHDLWHDNILIYRGKLMPMDFEDTVWGYPIQDIAMAVQDLMDDLPKDAFDPMFSAFRAGYESRLIWPESYDTEMDLFRLGRMLWVANWQANFNKEDFAEVVEKQAPMFEQFLATGKLRKIE